MWDAARTGNPAFRLNRRDATSFVVGAFPWDKSHG
jgi:hypothetical protein